MSDPATARPAATVILLRRGSRHRERGLELLLLRRVASASFMPGVWVFAGGAVEEDDHRRAAAGPGEIAREEWAHRICAARELGEEAGIVLGPEALVPWSRWVTPEVVPTRFDTRFYVAPAPPHARPVPDGREMDEARWLAPEAALRASGGGELELSFPTIRHLESLREHESAEAVLEAAATRVVEPILPRVIGTRESFRVLLPDEEGYAD
jgi:8-oxo-dGTP pyrophosphatase MutT (NUDIX family)